MLDSSGNEFDLTDSSLVGDLPPFNQPGATASLPLLDFEKTKYINYNYLMCLRYLSCSTIKQKQFCDTVCLFATR